MKGVITLSLMLVGYFFYGFYINQYEVSVIPTQLRSESTGLFNDYKGVINVHTDLSSGSAGSGFVISSAKMANLDWLMFTDLNVFGVDRSYESYHGNVLSLVGGKYSYLDSRLIHYSITQKNLGQNLGDAQVKLADLLSQETADNKDSFVILAHPYKAGFSWTGEVPTGMDGFELLNMKSLLNRAWQESKISMLWSLLIYPFNPQLAFVRLFSEPIDETALLDRVSQQRKVFIFAGTEASARVIPLSNYLIRFPSYKRSFEFMSNHVLLKSELTGNFHNDRAKIVSALKNGNSYVALDMLGDPRGFSASIDDGSTNYMMGSSIKFRKNLQLTIRLPAEPKSFYEILVIRDGVPAARINKTPATFEIMEPGVYRVHVRVSPLLPLPDAKKWISWIYTNPFYITP